MNAKQREIARLLRTGLDHYGDGDSESAVRAWNAILALDPHNADARDYIDSVEEGTAQEVQDAHRPLEAGEQTLLEEAVGLAAQGREKQAHALVESQVDASGLDPETLAVVELVRARLLPVYRAGFRRDALPRAAGDASQLCEWGLPAPAHALHAHCDGRTTIEELPEVSGLDAFDTLHHLSMLVDAGLVSIYE